MLLAICHSPARAQSFPQIVINELHYHPRSENHGEEFIELYNAGAEEVDLSGWRFSDGVSYTFPLSTTLPPGGYLVIANDPAVAEAVYGLSGALGPFVETRLSNSGERLALEDAAQQLVDETTYDDHLPWPETPDGKGPSLELINPAFDNDRPCSWAASVGAPTPGARNSVYVAGNIPPCITGAVHAPLFPSSAQTVTVTAWVDDAGIAAPGLAAVTLHYRPEGSSNYRALPMSPSGEGYRYAAVIPAQANGKSVEFYLSAVDHEGAERRVPAGAPGGVSAETGLPLTVSYLYLVEDAPPAESLPVYRLIMTGQNWAELTTRSLFSNRLLDATFVYSREVYYNVGVRYRGESSRASWPRPYRIKFPDEREFEDRERLNLVSDELAREALSHDLFARAGLPAARTRFVTFYINAGRQGDYLDVEQVDNDFLEAHFPDDSPRGNLYRAYDGGDLGYRGSDPNSYRSYYVKQNNEEADDYSDIIALTDALSNSSDETLFARAEALADMRQWMRWFAVQAVLDNHEGALWTGQGDDYFLYRRRSDDRFVLISWDHDSTFRNATHSIWEPNTLARPVVRRILNYPPFARWYYQNIADLAAHAFSTAEMYPRIDALPSAVSGSMKNTLKQYVAARIPSLYGEIPGGALSISTNGGRDIVATQPQITLEGTCSPLRDVYVNGDPARVRYPTVATWRFTADLPARDNLFVISDGVDSRTITVYLDTFHGGQLTQDTTLVASQRPYLISSDIIVPAGVTLTVEPGATLHFQADRTLQVKGGRLLAVGTAAQPITFTRASDGYWGGVLLENTHADNRIEHALIEYLKQVIDYPRTQGVSLYGARATVADSVIRHTAYPCVAVQSYPWNGQPPALHLLRNEIYAIQNDAVHATGGEAVIQGNHIHDIRYGEYAMEGIELSDMVTPTVFTDNRIHDVSDDCLDINGASALIARNEFRACGDKGVSVGQAPAVVTITNNLVDTCIGKASDPLSGAGVAVKDGAVARIVNNTVVHCEHGVHLYEGHAGQGGGVAMLLNNILWDNRRAGLELDALSTVVVAYSDIQEQWPGEGNILADPLFVDAAAGDYRLQEGSPCVDAGALDGAPPDDLAGLYRPQGWRPDMGAYERPVAFAIATHGGRDFFTTTQQVRLEGTVPYSRAVWVNGDSLGVARPTATTWRYTATLQTRDNAFTVTDGLETLAIAVYWDYFRGGVVSDNLTLVASRYPYTVSEDVFVPRGVTLTIEPGVELRFMPGRAAVVEGRLLAEGAPGRPILFTRALTEAWGGLLFRETREGNRIARATVEGVDGAALAAYSATLRVEATVVRESGAGLSATVASSVTVVNGLFYACAGDALAADWGGSLSLVNNTVVANGGGLRLGEDGRAALLNAIVWGNDVDAALDARAAVTITHSDILSPTTGSAWVGEGNISADPLFRDAARRDYRLRRESPCVDAGALEGAPAEDLPGLPRPRGAAPDMGAYEFFEYYSIYLPLTLRLTL